LWSLLASGELRVGRVRRTDGFVGSNATFVDFGMPGLGVAANGTVFRPSTTFDDGFANVASGAAMTMAAGSYSPAAAGAYTFSKPITIQAPVGVVTISAGYGPGAGS
jgi:hypothetical protein